NGIQFIDGRICHKSPTDGAVVDRRAVGGCEGRRGTQAARFQLALRAGDRTARRSRCARAELVLKATIGADGNSAEMAVEKADFYELLADGNRLLLHEGVPIPPPRYPPAAAQAGVAADVTMVVTVD